MERTGYVDYQSGGVWSNTFVNPDRATDSRYNLWRRYYMYGGEISITASFRATDRDKVLAKVDAMVRGLEK